MSGVHFAKARAMGRAGGFAKRWMMFGAAALSAACAAAPDGHTDGGPATHVVVEDLSGFDVLMGVCAELRVAAAEAKSKQKQKPGASLCEYAATHARGCYPQATRLSCATFASGRTCATRAANRRCFARRAVGVDSLSSGPAVAGSASPRCPHRWADRVNVIAM